MNLLCRFWGHDPHPEAAEFYCVYDCRRCGELYDQDMGLREWAKVRWWHLCYWASLRIAAWRYWLRCTDCGKRFGRHDDNADHLPF